ncbi:18460_t:CDS:2, partial [Acaulospora morrowiae]
MAEVAIAYLGILGIIDSVLHSIDRISVLVQAFKNAPEKIVEVQMKLVISKEVAKNLRKYLTTNELEESVQESLMVHIRVLNQVLTKCEYYVKRNQRNIVGSMWYASIGKTKLSNEIQRLNDWNRLVGDLVSSLVALDVSTLTTTLNQCEKSSEHLYTFMRIVTKAILIRDRKNIPRDDNDLQDVVLDEDEIENYDVLNNQLRGYGQWRGNEVMIEKINMKEISGAKQSRQRTDLRRLALLLKQYKQCHHIMEFIGIAEIDSDHVLMISDGSVKTTLKDIIDGYDRLESIDRKKVAAGVADGLIYLHSSGILHKDIRSSNIFINLNDKRPLISGFTLSRKIDWDSVRHHENSLEARIWQAPERFG